MVATQAQLEQAMEKPTIIMPEERPKRKLNWSHGLFFYAGVVTAALVVVLALGSVLLSQSQEMCDASQDKTDAVGQNSGNKGPRKVLRRKLVVQDGKDKQEEETELDETNDIEVILTKVNGSRHPSITVVDFKKGYSGIYEPESEECFLIGGLDKRISKEQDDDDDTVIIKEEDDYRTYTKTEDEPLSDSSVMPGELKDVCKGKPIYWMEKTCDGEVGRQKRGLCYRCYYRCYLFRIGFRTYRRCYRYCYLRFC